MGEGHVVGVDHPHLSSPSVFSSWRSLSPLMSSGQLQAAPLAIMKLHGACYHDQKLPRSHLRGATSGDSPSFAIVDAMRQRSRRPSVAVRPLSMTMEVSFELLTTC